MTKSYGEHIQEERRKENQEKYEESVRERFDLAYRCLADGRTGDALQLTLKLFFQLSDRKTAPTYNPLLMKDQAGFDSDHNWVPLSRYLRRFEDVVNEKVSGDVTGAFGRVHEPERVMSALIEHDIHVGASVIAASRTGSTRRHHARVEECLKCLEAVAVARDLLPADVADTYTLGEDFEESPLHELYEKRRRQDRDLKVIVTARDSETGTGKTTLAVQLCQLWDVHGWDGEEKASHDPDSFLEAYESLPQGSAFLMDEGGQAFDSRRSMSSTNVEASHDWQMGRYRQVYTVITLPSVSMLDKRMKELADIRINVTRRGHARVYRMKVDDFDSSTFAEHICNVEWGAMDGDPDYEAVEASKARRMEGSGDGGGDGSEQIDAEAVRREARNEVIRELVDDGMSQSDVADALDLSPSMVSRICNPD